jgi:hypothetical protein
MLSIRDDHVQSIDGATLKNCNQSFARVPDAPNVSPTPASGTNAAAIIPNEARRFRRI